MIRLALVASLVASMIGLGVTSFGANRILFRSLLSGAATGSTR
jgi:hypothetical protein